MVAGSSPLAEWIDDESNAVDIVDIVIFHSDNVVSLTNDKEVYDDDDDVKISNWSPKDVSCMVQVQTNTLSWEDHNDEMEDANDAKEEQAKWRAQNEKEKRVLELLQVVEECSSKFKKLHQQISSQEPIFRMKKRGFKIYWACRKWNCKKCSWKTPPWHLWAIYKWWIEG